jgi:hypothetical protein
MAVKSSQNVLGRETGFSYCQSLRFYTKERPKNRPVPSILIIELILQKLKKKTFQKLLWQ